MKTLYVSAVVLALAGLHPAQAQQSLWEMNSRFDQSIEGLIRQGQAAAAAQMQGAQAAQMRIFGPQLLRAWHQSGLDQVMSFEQFRYQMLISANGTDIAGAVAALQIQYLGNRRAYGTQQEIGDIYRRGMVDSSQRRGVAVNRWDQGVIRGQGAYVDANGNAVGLPNYAPGQWYREPNGARYYQGTDGYWRDQNGYFLNPQ
jgi:hypothetical protein